MFQRLLPFVLVFLLLFCASGISLDLAAVGEEASAVDLSTAEADIEVAGN